jgi:protein CpxP
MKRLIYTMAFVVMGITSSYAQQSDGQGRHRETPEQRAEKQATTLEAKLGLTADQKQKVQALELERFKKSEEWRKSDDGDRKGKMEERKAFMEAAKIKMEAILTPEQKTKWEAARQEMKKGGHGKGPRVPKGQNTPPAPANN